MRRRHVLRFALTLPLGAGALLFAQCHSSDRNAADWPGFRGPLQNGHSSATGLPTSWAPDKNIVWQSVLHGRAWSSPVVAGNRIFLTNATNARDDDDVHASVKLHVLALDSADGKVLWNRELFSIAEPCPKGFHEQNSHASATPVFDRGRIYAQFGNFGSACVDESGNIIWKTQEPAFQTELGNGGSPVIVDDLMIFHCDGVEDPFVVALDKATGKIRWKTPRGRKARNVYGLSTPLVIEANGIRQIICVGTRIVQALAPKDGHEIWKVYHDEYCPVARPVFADGLVFVSTGREKSSLLAINPEGRGNITETNVVWRTQQNVPLTPSPLAVDGNLFLAADNGLVTCLDTKTGMQHWQERVGRTMSASPLYADGKIYLQDESGKGYVIKAGGKYELLSANDLGDPSLASYAVMGNRLLIRTRHALWCVEQAKG